jgi:hypothetical protein
MRRTLARLGMATSIVVGTLLLAAGPASAGRPQDSQGDKDCRLTAVCHPGLHVGETKGRNVGG